MAGACAPHLVSHRSASRLNLPTLAQVMHCATAVLRALVDHGKKLEKLRAGPEAAALDRCELGAIQAKLDSVQHQVSQPAPGVPEIACSA